MQTREPETFRELSRECACGAYIITNDTQLYHHWVERHQNYPRLGYFGHRGAEFAELRGADPRE